MRLKPLIPSPGSIHSDELPPGLQLSPIRNAVEPLNRRLSVMWSLVTYGVIFLGVRYYYSTVLNTANTLRPTVSAERIVQVVYLQDPLPEMEGQQGGSSGTGTIDARLLTMERAEVPVYWDSESFEVTESAPEHRFRGDLSLPVAVGGDGFAKGSGTGTGSGSGAGSGSGKVGMISGVKGDGPSVAFNDLEVLRQVVPQYPSIARRMHLEGWVVLRVTINELGVPVEVKVISGHELFHANTIEAMKLWRFGSIKHQDRPVLATFDVTFAYLFTYE